MKRFFVFTLIVLLCSCIQEQLTSFPEEDSANQRTAINENYYWYCGEKIPLYENSNQVFAVFDKKLVGILHDPVTKSNSTRSLNAKPYHTSAKVFKTGGHPENIK